MCNFPWDTAPKGGGCDANWYFGILEHRPTYPHPQLPAPALLGFDETIYGYCSAKIHRPETVRFRTPTYQQSCNGRVESRPLWHTHPTDGN